MPEGIGEWIAVVMAIVAFAVAIWSWWTWKFSWENDRGE